MFSPQEKIIVEFIKMAPFKSLRIHLILNTVLLPEGSTAVFCLFVWFVIVVHESIVCPSWTVKLPAVLQKNPSGPTNLLQHFLHIWTLSNNLMIWDLFTLRTHMQLSQKLQTLTDAPEGNTMSLGCTFLNRMKIWMCTSFIFCLDIMFCI